MSRFQRPTRLFSPEIAAGSSAIAFILQYLGYSETCTGGDTGGFYVGAIFSAPFLLLPLAIMVHAVLVRSQYDRRKILWRTAVFAVAAALVYMNSTLAWGVLTTGASPCFITYDFSNYKLPALFSGEYEAEHFRIGLMYGAVPLLLMICSGMSVLKNIFQQ